MRITLIRETQSHVPQRYVFELVPGDEILLGRDPSCKVSLPAEDSVASRIHAAIRVDKNDAAGLMVTDLNSRNGTFVDGIRVRGTTGLKDGSKILLGVSDGEKGPLFACQIEDDAGLGMRTMYSSSEPTRRVGESSLRWWEGRLPGVKPMAHSPSQEPGPADLPRSSDVRPRGKAIWLVAGIGLVLLALGSYWYGFRSARGTVAEEVVKKYGTALFSTHLTWKLVDRESGYQVFHWQIPPPPSAEGGQLSKLRGRARVPVFLRMQDGMIEPVLILDAERGTNLPVGGSEIGTAVAVHRSGFLLTDRRKATPWLLPYQWQTASAPGILIDAPSQRIDVLNSAPAAWVPSRSRAVLLKSRPIAELMQSGLPPLRTALEGRSDRFEAWPPGSRGRFQATLSIRGLDWPLALAKIERIGSVEDEVSVPASDPTLAVSESVFVLTAADKGARGESAMVVEAQVLSLPAKGTNQSVESSIQISKQFTPTETGAPVFDRSGKLAGLLRVSAHAAGTINEVVPIRYGRALLSPGKEP